MRSPALIGRLRMSSEKVIVATPLGPNQPMKTLALALRRTRSNETKIDERPDHEQRPGRRSRRRPTRR